MSGISSIHQSLVTTLQTVAEPQRAQVGYVAAALTQGAPNEVRGPIGGVLTDKLEDLREKKEKGNQGFQGLALGHNLGNGPDKDKGKGKDEDKKEKESKKEKKKKKSKKKK